MRTVALLSNPASGGNRAGTRLDAVRTVARDAGIAHVETGTPADLPAVLARFARDGVRLLAINGGDGTVAAAVTALRTTGAFRVEPAIAVLPGGTTNMIARDAGLSGPPAEGLWRLLAGWRSGSHAMVARRPLLVRCNGAAPRYGFFVATAAIPRVTEMARRRLHGRGLTGPTGWRLTLAWSLGRLLLGRIERDPLLAPDRMAIACNGDAWQERRAVLLFATTLDTLVLGLRPTAPGDGLAVIALFAPFRGLWRRLPSLLRRPWPVGEHAGIFARQATRLQARTPAAWVLDGEPLPAGREAILSIEAAAPLRFAVA